MSVFIPYLLTFGIAFLICIIIAPVLIPFLHRLKFGQQIREDGPTWHQKKSGTPTMGGIIFILGSLGATMFFVRDAAVITVMLFALGFGIIGFADDFIKVVLKRNLGLTAIQKFALQIAFSIAFVVVLSALDMLKTDIYIPFTNMTLDLGWFYIVFVVFIMVGFTNAVNLTDGLDGLATSVTAVVSLFFALAAFLMENKELCIFMIALFGGCVGFLVFNHHPAKVFMGDTGSLFLGGALAAASIVLKMPLILVIAGIIYVVEALSVMLQVASFKLTGKRIFKMSPIHHHFEMCGWNEVKIVTVFSIVTILFCIVAYFSTLPFLA
ncbi:MAG: phospho-N-acetylmuramoyl-pentapeptide-transferase [Ruminococcaceae bacterium]|nr:phospho-N-acetylmuramoyl-pentapeptide-transferase [Oscillospiraceae bacterium]